MSSGISKKEVWLDRLEEQRRSGISVAAFCRLRGFGEASFYYWKRRLNRAVLEKPKAENGFVSIDVPAVSPPDSIEIVHRDGWRIVVPKRFDRDQLRAVLNLLEERAC